MLVLLENKTDIAVAQKKLQSTVRRDFRSTVVRTIGFPSGNTGPVEVWTDGVYWFWSRDERGKQVKTPRRLNWFGLLNEQSQLDITVEVNTPYYGRNGVVAGFYARDPTRVWFISCTRAELAEEHRVLASWNF